LNNVRLNVALTFNAKPARQWEGNDNISLNAGDTHPLQTKLTDTYAEWDTWETINAVKNAIEVFHNVTLIEADEEAFQKLKTLKPDIVFNIAEGFNGVSREAQIPAILEMLNIPYTGSDPLTLSICLDKARTKEILTYHSIPTPKFFIMDNYRQIEKTNLKFPLMVKPNMEGSGKGIYSSSLVKNQNELKKEIGRINSEYDQPALVEEFLSGREFTVAVIGNGAGANVLPIVEINFDQFPKDFIPIYSFEAKWILDTRENPLDVFACPALVSDELEDLIKSTVLKTYNVLRCRDWSRIDVRLDSNGIPNIIELNPLPGILPDPEENSCFPKAARTAGYNYNDMINLVLFEAAKRYNLV
jgi:D-alanine-D-alanine ligase